MYKKHKITGTISYPDNHGVQARVCGKHVGYFAFSQYMHAERKAKSFLKTYIALMEPRIPKPKRNNTGHPGLSYSTAKRKGYEYGRIQFRVDGKQRVVSCGRVDAPDLERRKRKAILAAKRIIKGE